MLDAPWSRITASAQPELHAMAVMMLVTAGRPLPTFSKLVNQEVKDVCNQGERWTGVHCVCPANTACQGARCTNGHTDDTGASALHGYNPSICMSCACSINTVAVATPPRLIHPKAAGDEKGEGGCGAQLVWEPFARGTWQGENDTDANSDVTEKQRFRALAAGAANGDSAKADSVTGAVRSVNGPKFWMDFTLCTGPIAAIDRCRQHCSDADVAAWRSSDFAQHAKIPLFVKTHKVAGSLFGRQLKRAQLLHHERTQCGTDAAMNTTPAVRQNISADDGMSTRRACRKTMHRFLRRHDFGHELKDALTCCGAEQALLSHKTRCTPPEHTVTITLVREPIDHLLSAFLYHRSFERPELYPEYHPDAIYKAGKYPASWPNDLLAAAGLTASGMLHPRSVLQEYYVGSVLRKRWATNISPLLGAAGADREGRRPTLVGAPCDGNYSQVVAAAIEELARIQVVGTQADLNASLAMALVKLQWLPPPEAFSLDWVLNHPSTNVATSKRQDTRPTAADIPPGILAKIKSNPWHRAEVAFYAAALAQAAKAVASLSAPAKTTYFRLLGRPQAVDTA